MTEVARACRHPRLHIVVRAISLQQKVVRAMAKHASVIRAYRFPDGSVGLMVDGEEFPWSITAEGPRIGPLTPDTLPSITVTITADRVEVVNDIGPAPEPRKAPDLTK